MRMSSRPALTDPASADDGTDIESFFGIASRFMPQALIDDTGWERLSERLRGIPASAMQSSMAGFEFALWDPEPSADFGPIVLAGSLLARYLADQGSAAAPGSWEAALGAFVSQMSEDAWPTDAILEYDVRGVARGEKPRPGIFVNVAPYPQIVGMPSPGEALDIMFDASCVQRDSGARAAVERVSEALPPGAFVTLIGAMPARSVRAARVSLGGVRAREVAGILGRIGWPGSIPLVEETLMDMLSTAKQFGISLDVTAEGPLPRIGLELSPTGDGLSASDNWATTSRDDWRPLIEHLVAAGLCLPAKGEALLEFCGRDRLMSPFGAILVYRAIAGLKVMVSEDGLQAKCYAFVVVSPQR